MDIVRDNQRKTCVNIQLEYQNEFNFLKILRIAINRCNNELNGKQSFG